MATIFTFRDSDGVTPLTTLNLSTLRPGLSLEKLLYLHTTAAVNAVYISIFPGLKNKTITNIVGSPVSYVRVMKQDTAANVMKEDVLHTDVLGELTKKTDRISAWFYNGSTYTDVSSGNITFPKNTTEKLYIGCDYVYRNLYFNQTTPAGGSAGIVFKYNASGGFSALPGDASDGTITQTTAGTYFLGTLTPDLWVKVKINNEYKYWIEITCTTTEATPCVCDVVYWDNVFQFAKSLLYGAPTMYVKSTDATPVYTADTSQVYEYNNNGEIMYDTSPLGAGEELTADYSYKLPEIPVADPVVLFSSSTACTVDGGPEITVVSDSATDNTNVIDGINFRFNSTADASDSFSVNISEMLKHLWLATDNSGEPNAYQNSDLLLGNLTADSATPFWVEFRPPSDMVTTNNSQAISAYCHGVSA
jgi:hypothetical protein